MGSGWEWLTESGRWIPLLLSGVALFAAAGLWQKKGGLSLLFLIAIAAAGYLGWVALGDID